MRMRNLALWLLTALFGFNLSAALQYGDIVTIKPDLARKIPNWYLTVRKDKNSDIREVKDVGDAEKWILAATKKVSAGTDIKVGNPILLQSFQTKEYLVATKGNEVASISFNMERIPMAPPYARWEMASLNVAVGSPVNAGDVVSFKSFNNMYLRGGHTGAIHPHDVDLAKEIKSNEKWVMTKVGAIETPVDSTETQSDSQTSPEDTSVSLDPEISAKVNLPRGFVPMIPGGIEGVAVGFGARGKTLILARGKAGVIFRAEIVEARPGQPIRPGQVNWTRLTGVGIDLDVGSDGTMVAINKANKPYVWDFTMRGWTSLPDANMVRISVGKNSKDIWAVTKEGALVHLENDQWVNKKDQCKYVDAAADGTVAYIDTNNNVFVSYDSGVTFNQIPNLKLDVISVARQDIKFGIYRGNLYKEDKVKWTRAARGRNLKDLSIGPDGTFVIITSIVARDAAGAPSGSMAFYRKIKVPETPRPVKGPDTTTPGTEEVVVSETEETVVDSGTGFPASFFKIEGQPLKQVSVGINADGSTAIWGIASDDKIYQGTYQAGLMGVGPTINWTERGRGKSISVGKGVVFAIDTGGDIYKWNNEASNWESFAATMSGTGKFKMVSVAGPDKIWAVYNDGNIVWWGNDKWNETGTAEIGEFVNVAFDGTVMALNKNGQVYKWLNNSWSLQTASETFKEIYVGSADLVRAVSKTDGSWWIFEGGNWTKSPITQKITSGDINAKGDVALATDKNEVYFRQGTIVVAETEETTEAKPEDMTLVQRIDAAVAETTPLMKIQKLKEAAIWAKEKNATFPEAEAATKQWEFVGRHLNELNSLLSALPATDPTLKAFYDLLIKVVAYEPLYGPNGGYVNGWMDALKAKGVVVPAIEPPAPDAKFDDVLNAALARPSMDAQVESLSVIVNWVGTRELSLTEMGGFVFALSELAAKIKAMPIESDEQKNAKKAIQIKYVDFLNSIKDKTNLLGLSGKATVERLTTELSQTPTVTPPTATTTPAATTPTATTPTATTAAPRSSRR